MICILGIVAERLQSCAACAAVAAANTTGAPRLCLSELQSTTRLPPLLDKLHVLTVHVSQFNHPLLTKYFIYSPGGRIGGERLGRALAHFNKRVDGCGQDGCELGLATGRSTGAAVRFVGLLKRRHYFHQLTQALRHLDEQQIEAFRVSSIDKSFLAFWDFSATCYSSEGPKCPEACTVTKTFSCTNSPYNCAKIDAQYARHLPGESVTGRNFAPAVLLSLVEAERYILQHAYSLGPT